MTYETHNLYTLSFRQDAESKFITSISCLQNFHSEVPRASFSTNIVPVAEPQFVLSNMFMELYLV